MKSIKRIELRSDSALILVCTKIEGGVKDMYKCSSDLPNLCPLWNLLLSKNSVLNYIVCGCRDTLIKMTLTLLYNYNQHQLIVSLTFKKDKNLQNHHRIEQRRAKIKFQLHPWIFSKLSHWSSLQNSPTICYQKAKCENLEDNYLPRNKRQSSKDQRNKLNSDYQRLRSWLRKKHKKWENVPSLSLKIKEICIQWTPFQKPSCIKNCEHVPNCFN